VQRVHHAVYREGLVAVWRLSQGWLTFDRIRTRGPRREYGSLHFGFELRMMNDIEGVTKMGEGHCIASFLPILFLYGESSAATKI
jgi:hypothetical protein